MNAPMTAPMTADNALEQGLVITTSLESLLGTLLQRTRTRLSAQGPLADQLDSAQVLGYEFAFIKAELHAMRAMLEYGRACRALDAAPLEAAMALVFAADALPKIRARFERIRHAAELTSAEYLAVFEQPGLLDFCARHGAPEALAACGDALLEAGHCGRSLLDEDKQI
ncbi:MAG: hypothetical protein RL434_1622, partial [Pseudomonadota bacterium]